MRFNKDYGKAIQGEYVSTLGTALYWADESFAASFCYIHDSSKGAHFTSTGATGAYLNHCIFANITLDAVQVYLASKVMGCTFYNVGGIAVKCSSSYSSATNCIFIRAVRGLLGRSIICPTTTFSTTTPTITRAAYWLAKKTFSLTH